MRLEARTALYCHEFLHKTFAPNRFDLTYRIEVDPVVDEFKNLGIAHEDKVKEYLRTLNLRIKEIDIQQTDHDWQKETADTLLSEDYDLIFGANISDITESYLIPQLANSTHDDTRVSRPDVLVRLGRNFLGNPAWAPVDIKSHAAFGENKSNSVYLSPLETIAPSSDSSQVGRHSEEDAYQLAHYSCHLRTLGIATDQLWVGIIGRDFTQCAWAELDSITFGVGKKLDTALNKYLKDFSIASEITAASIIQNRDSSHHVNALPMMMTGNYGCPTCEFRDVCREEMEAFDNGSGHVTLLATVTPTKVQDKFPHISSIRQLLNETNLDKFGLESQIRARVWNSEIPEMLDPSKPLDLPSFDIEIDIDLENSQAILMDTFNETVDGKDLVYLYGYGLWDKSISSDWKRATFDSFSNYSDTDEGECEVLLAMWKYLTTQISLAEKAGKSIGIFHYSPHEKTWWRRFAKRHSGKPGVPSLEDVEIFCEKYLVDLYAYTQKISFPTISYSIKSLAPVANFKWSVEDPGGGMSLIKYKTAINPESDNQTREEVIDWLYRYNLDDVRATFAVREYIRAKFPSN